MKNFTRSAWVTASLSFLISAWGVAGQGGVQATTTLPPCPDHGADLAVNDTQVVQWKTTTRNQFLGRAHVTGTIHNIFPDHSGHNHFEIQMDTPAGDTLEIIYNQSFGALPTLHAGMRVEACGDYITSNAATSRYPASPDGAILHWIHNNTSAGHTGGGAFTGSSTAEIPALMETLRGHHGGGGNGGGTGGGSGGHSGGHEAGYLAIDGQVYGGY